MAEVVKRVKDAKAREMRRETGISLPGKQYASTALLPAIEEEALLCPTAPDNGEVNPQLPDGRFKFTLGISKLDGGDLLY